MTVTDMGTCPAVTVNGDAQLVRVKPVGWLRIYWLSECTCGRYRKRHRTWGAAMKDADVHAATHNLRAT